MPASLSLTIPLWAEPSGRVGKAYLINHVHNNLLLLRAWGPKIDIQIPKQKQFAGCGMPDPSIAEVMHSCHVSGRDVVSHHEKSNSPHDQLESQDVWGDDIHHLNRKVQVF